MYKKLDKNGVLNCMGIEFLILVTMNNIVILDAILCNMVEIKEFFPRILELEMEAEGSSKMLGFSQTI
jgi:hypothetical protein